MIPNLIFVLLSFILFMSCREHKQTEDQKKEITSEIKMMMNNYYNDIKSSGLLAEFKYLDSSKDFSWTPPGFSGTISFVAHLLRSNAVAFKVIKNSWHSLEIQVLSDKQASYNGIITSTVTDTSEKITHTILFEKGIVIKRKDGWKLLSGKTIILPQKDASYNK